MPKPTCRVEGVIVDGACRDVDECHAVGFSVYSRAAVPITARGRIVEELTGEPIKIGGHPFNPDDLVLADGSGVVFVPAARAEEVLEVAESIAAREAEMAAAVRAGRSILEVMGAEYERMLSH